jgi:hypothetical protein
MAQSQQTALKEACCTLAKGGNEGQRRDVEYYVLKKKVLWKVLSVLARHTSILYSFWHACE